MDHHSASVSAWPPEGVHLREASARIGAGHQDSAPLLSCLCQEDLFAYATHTSKAHRVPGDLIVDVDFASSTVILADGGAHRVTVVPILKSPHRAEAVSDRFFAEVFQRYVLNDPEVVHLSRRAIEIRPELYRVFVDGCCTPHGVEQWPAKFERHFIGGIHERDSALGSLLTDEHPDVVGAIEVLKDRYAAFIRMLREGNVEGYGLPSHAAYPPVIMRSLWSHRDIEIDPRTGDVFTANLAAVDPPIDRLIKLWTGIMLRAGIMNAPLRSVSSACSIAPSVAAPFSVDMILKVGTLVRALDELVFEDADVEQLRKAAFHASPKQFDGTGGFVSFVDGHSDPMLPVRLTTGGPYNPEHEIEVLPPELAVFDVPQAPAELRTLRAAIQNRIDALFGPLRRSEIRALGHASDGHLVSISPSIWEHGHHYIHTATGDVYEAIPGRLMKRWSSPYFEDARFKSPPTRESMFHVKSPQHAGVRSNRIATRQGLASKTAHQESIDEAVLALWPHGIPSGLSLKQRDAFIIEWQKRNGRATSSSKSIRRYLPAKPI